MEREDDSEAEDGGGGNQADLLKSYLAFARRAIRKRRGIAAAIFFTVVLVSSAALAVWPRLYQCELRLLVQRSAVLDPDDKSEQLWSASSLLKRQENLASMVRQLDLAKDWEASRPPVLRWKDQVMERIRGGKPSEQDVRDALTSMLESRMWADTEDSRLTIHADWSDGQTAKRIVDAAKDSFLEARHNAEIGVVEEKMSILESHAARLLTEIEGIAQDINRMKEEKLAKAEQAARRVSEAAAPAPTRAPSVRRSIPLPSLSALAIASEEQPLSEDDLATMKQDLEDKKRKLGELQSRRGQSSLEAKSRLADLKLRLTDDHPEVRAQEQRVVMLSEVSPEEASLKSSVEQLDVTLRRRRAVPRVDATAARSGGGGSASAPRPTASDVVPGEILRLLDNSAELDPAIGTQLSTALTKYVELRGQIRTARITLDTAQAAFDYRYKIISPAVAPPRPTKPKVPQVLASALLAALALALIIPILLELKTGVIVERWQVHMMQLPVLGELQMPPRDDPRNL